jgi:rRNA processing protein Krr1/Pno1
VVDFVNDVTDVTEEVLNHVAANTEEITQQLEELTAESTILLEADTGSVEITNEQRGASARELLKAREAILEANAIYTNGLKAMAQSLRAQIAAMRRPKP